MWIYNCPLGKMEIKFDHNVKKYALWLGDECGIRLGRISPGRESRSR